MSGKMRKFKSGASRDSNEGKYEYSGFLCPLVIRRYAEYMNKHRIQSDGTLRSSNNWKKGIPLEAYMESGYRHFHDWWMEHEGYKSREGLEEALMALLFNVMGYAHEILKRKEIKKENGTGKS